jgi:hypothetical protein
LIIFGCDRLIDLWATSSLLDANYVYLEALARIVMFATNLLCRDIMPDALPRSTDVITLYAAQRRSG